MSELRRKTNPERRAEWWTTLPSAGWLLIFFAIPTLLIVVMSFKPAGPYGGFGEGWSLKAWVDMGNPSYPTVLWRTIRLSLAATLICIALGLPVGFLLGRSDAKTRSILLLLVVVPFWTNFLIRVYAWKVLLHPSGFFRETLVSFGVIGENTLLLYNEWAVLLVMVYAYVPFAILPIYASAEKFDFALLDAARDLGASSIRAFWLVFVPGVSRGVMAAVVMVLIPALGSYIIPELVGGPTGEMIGNKIAQRVFIDRNWPHAAALATVLMIVTLLPVLFAFAQEKRESIAVGKKGGDASS
ncbi:MAG: ABC transporter permease [Verrucomicrobiae bacterium]|nr:ABC transporter permease [Verrucomicrobiae bacterium]